MGTVTRLNVITSLLVGLSVTAHADVITDWNDAVLEVFFGDAVPPFSLTSPTAPGVTRRFSRLSDYVKESIDARVYDGVHYRTSGEVGAAMGRKIRAFTVQNSLKPVR